MPQATSPFMGHSVSENLAAQGSSGLILGPSMNEYSAPIKAREAFARQLQPLASRRPVLIRCWSCQKVVPSGMKWRCGYCKHENHRTEIYSFLYKCQKCGQEPQSFVCPHCTEWSFFTSDETDKHPARKISEPPPPLPPHTQEDPRAKKWREHKELKEEKRREIERLRLEAEVNRARAAVEVKPELTEQERAEKELLARAMRHLRHYAAGPKVKAILMKELKDNPEAIARIDEVLQDIIERLD